MSQYPDPDMFNDWRSWAKSLVNRGRSKSRFEDNWISGWTSLENAEYPSAAPEVDPDWMAVAADPPGFFRFKSGLVVLCGAVETFDKVASPNQSTILVLPLEARPLREPDSTYGIPFRKTYHEVATGLPVTTDVFVFADGSIDMSISSKNDVKLSLCGIAFQGVPQE